RIRGRGRRWRRSTPRCRSWSPSPRHCKRPDNGRSGDRAMPSDVTLGIDFGTSCTSAGILIGDRVELIHDGGDPVIPSVVYAPERGPLEAGRPAQARLLSDPACVIRSVKRVLGVAPASPLVRSYAA